MYTQSFRLLISALRIAGYEWQAQTPDRLLSFRKNPAPFRPLVQLFGLGTQVSARALVEDEFAPGVLKSLIDAKLIDIDIDENCRANIAISGSGDLFIIHDHWPPDPVKHSFEKGGFVHYANESSVLARIILRELEGFIGKRILDLGCSSGGLAFEVAGVAEEVLGFDISVRAIDFARSLAKTYGFMNTRFETAAVGFPDAERITGEKKWDAVLFNPPMVIPAKDVSYPHRDGGEMGIELPLSFLSFSYRHLKPDGEVLCLITNPIVSGKGLFFEKMRETGNWEFLEKRCIHTHFNQSVARKVGYAEQGVERIELWLMHLRKQPR